MLLILLYWLFLFLFFLSGGIAIKKIFKISTDNLWLLLLLGMFYSTCCFSIAAFFIALNKVPLSILIVLSSVIFYRNRKQISDILNNNWVKIQSLTKFNKGAIIILLFCSLLKSSQYPHIIDNESYYIQTIKWLNEFGYVKGLANLHLFFGQTSGWHILQAGLNFSFLYNLNDINGFILGICFIYYISEFQEHYFRTGRIHWIGVLPVFAIVYILFTDSPSPDLPVILIVPVIIYLLSTGDLSIENFKPAFLLFLLIALIKITVAPLILVFIYSLKKREHLLCSIITCSIAAGLWLAKNCIISGHPLYPITNMPVNFEWALPNEISEGIHISTNKYVYDTGSVYFMDKIYSWITQKGIEGLIHKLLLMLLLAVPFLKCVRTNRILLLCYFAFVLQFVILLFISPQYRFYLPLLLFFSAVLLSEILNKFIACKYVYSGIITVGLVFICYETISNNISGTFSRNFINDSFNSSQFFLPQSITSQPEMFYSKHFFGNLTYYSPDKQRWIYYTGNGPLPCVNNKQINYFKKRFNTIPQMRTKELKDGFISKKVYGLSQ